MIDERSTQMLKKEGEYTPAEIEKIMEAGNFNTDFLLANLKGHLMGESWGGEAGRKKFGRHDYICAGANIVAPDESWKIQTLSNDPEDFLGKRNGVFRCGRTILSDGENTSNPMILEFYIRTADLEENEKKYAIDVMRATRFSHNVASSRNFEELLIAIELEKNLPDGIKLRDASGKEMDYNDVVVVIRRFELGYEKEPGAITRLFGLRKKIRELISGRKV